MKHKCEHKHANEEESQGILKIMYDKHNAMFREVQDALKSEGYCQGDFFDILVNFSVTATVNVMEYLESHGDMSRECLIDLIIGGIVKNIGAQFISVQDLKPPEGLPLH